MTDKWFNLIQIHSGLGTPDVIFENEKLQVAVEVQKCLCNLIFNSSVVAAQCCKNGILQQITERLKTCEEKKLPEQIKFFHVKQLFLLTALCGEIRNRVRTEMNGTISLIQILEVTLKRAAEQATSGNIALDVFSSDFS